MSKDTRPMPGGRGKGYAPTKGMKFQKGTIKRLLSYVAEYKFRLIFVVICILVSSVASVASSLFIQTLIDEHILPLLLEANPVFGGLAKAFCIDVGFSTDIPGLPETKYGHMHLGDGVVICHSCDNDKDLTELLKETSIENGIPYQSYTSLSPTGGTDTCKIQLIGEGVKTALLAIPNRYMHTPIEMCDLRDVDAAIDLLLKTILQLN